MNIKVLSRISYIISAISLIVGASFHGYRMHPEDLEKYNLGVTMGIIMMSAFVFFLLVGIILAIIQRKNRDNKDKS